MNRADLPPSHHLLPFAAPSGAVFDTIYLMLSYISTKHLVLVLGLLILNIVGFTLINPLNSPSIMLFLGFGLLAADFFLMFYVLTRITQKIFGRPRHSARRVASILTGVVIVLLALQSIGQLSVRDTIAVSLVCCLVYFYLSYYRPSQR